MFAQPQNVVNSGTVASSNMSDAATGHYDYTSNRIYGGRVYGPGTFFMKENEVLKCSPKQIQIVMPLSILILD